MDDFVKLAANVGNLRARIAIMEGHTAALIAFVAALLENHPMRDILEPRWSNAIGPALTEFGPDASSEMEPAVAATTHVPDWIDVYLDNDKGR